MKIVRIFATIACMAMAPALLFAGQVVKTYSFDPPVVSNGKVHFPGGRPAFVPFAPNVDVQPVSLLLPYGQTARSFKVDHGDPIELAGTWYLRPFRPDGRLSFRPPQDFLTKRAREYGISRFFPATVKGEWSSVQYAHGQPVFMTKINPVQYNPVTGKLRYFPTVRVTVQTGPGDEPLYKSSAVIRSRLAALVDNKEAAAALPDGPVGPDDYEYLIITTDSLKNRFTSFIDFNKRRGLRTNIATLSSVRAAMQGRDDQEKMRAFIKKEYADHAIAYVLLAGDADADPARPSQNRIPHRGMRSQVYDFGTDFYDDPDIPADDMYFGCLDGTWQRTGSTYFGEYGCEDLTHEVYVGRFSVDDAVELQNMIDKTIRYSEQPVAGKIMNTLLAGEKLWGTWDNPPHPLDCWGDDLMKQFMGACTANGYATAGFPPAEWKSVKLFDHDFPWTRADFFRAVDTGKVTWIDHIGHANNTRLFKADVTDMTAAAFPQNGSASNYFIAYSGACEPGAFDNRLSTPGQYTQLDCVGEQLTTMATGAVACIFSARYGYGDDGADGSSGTDGSSQRLHRLFHDAIFGHRIHHLGMMNAWSKERVANIIADSVTTRKPYYGQMKWVAYETNLLGDPALSVWTTNSPQQLAPALPSPLRSDRFAVQVPPYSWVALADSAGAVVCTQLTDSSGACAIQNGVLSAFLSRHLHGTMRVIIKAHDYFPYSGTINFDVPVLWKGGAGIAPVSASFVRSGRGWTMRYTLESSARVTVELFDGRGKLVAAVADGLRPAGEHRVVFPGLAAGIYCCRLKTGSAIFEKRFAALK